jgi:hypothetical protein
MMPNLFEQFLNNVNRGYGQVDKNVFKGALPGGASISSSIAPTVKVLSTSPVYKTVRDKALVPVLDFAMEKGIVPAKEGMFARFLSGTAVPIERIPADTRVAESLMNTRLSNPTQKDKKLIELEQVQSLLDTKTGITSAQTERYLYTGKGTMPTTQQQQEINQLKEKRNSLTKDLKIKDYFAIYETDYSSARKTVGYNPRDYMVNDYNNIGATGLDFNLKQDEAINKGLVNTLGRYKVEDGRTKEERYDFNSYNVGTPLFAEGSMVGGVVGENEGSRKLADKALKIADTLGFIKPGAGYPVNFKFR